MARFLVDTERKMGKWLHDCKGSYSSHVDSPGLTQPQKGALKAKVNNYVTGGGVYADGAVKLDVNMWGSIRGTE